MKITSIPVDELINRALKYIDNSYSPYSGVKVSSVVLTENGNYYLGVNVENSSYGLTICAERVALTNMITHGDRRPVAVAIVSNLDKPVKPCGACRQFIAEFNPDALIISHSYKSNETEIYWLRSIYPEPFTLTNYVEKRRVTSSEP